MATPKVSEFKELKMDPLIQLDLGDPSSSSTELWLIRWPFDHNKANTPWPNIADFDGQEATINLNSETEFGNFQSSSGKSYEFRSVQSYTPEEVVFQSSASDTKIVGKISRHVSLVHYPEASELEKPDKELARKLGQGSSATSLTGSARRSATPTQTIRSRHFQTSTGTTSNPGSGKRDLSSESSKSKKRRRSSDASGSLGHSDRGSGGGHSTVTSSGGSRNQSDERKSKKKKKRESGNEG